MYCKICLYEYINIQKVFFFFLEEYKKPDIGFRKFVSKLLIYLSN